jgi:hypothetical protein
MLKPKTANIQNHTINARLELSSAHGPHGQSEVKKGNTRFAQVDSKKEGYRCVRGGEARRHSTRSGDAWPTTALIELCQIVEEEGQR